eukprot:gene27242-7131_t
MRRLLGGDAPPRNGKLTICDLAGSERLGKSQVDGDGMREAIAINKSLTALGNALSKQKPQKAGFFTGKGGHVPYRDHELTLALQGGRRACGNSAHRDSVGGTAKTLLFVNVSPAGDSAQETRCSLAFAQRAKHIVRKGPPRGRCAGDGDREEREAQRAVLEQREEELKQLRVTQKSAALLEGEEAIAAAEQGSGLAPWRAPPQHSAVVHHKAHHAGWDAVPPALRDAILSSPVPRLWVHPSCPPPPDPDADPLQRPHGMWLPWSGPGDPADGLPRFLTQGRCGAAEWVCGAATTGRPAARCVGLRRRGDLLQGVWGCDDGVDLLQGVWGCDDG